jgi:uncharacterized protein (DUF736 family)
MSDFDNTNSGALFKNDKRTNDRQPQYRGRINAGGVEFWVSAWVKKSRNGANFMSLALTPVEEQVESGASDVDFDSDVPF